MSKQSFSMMVDLDLGPAYLRAKPMLFWSTITPVTYLRLFLFFSPLFCFLPLHSSAGQFCESADFTEKNGQCSIVSSIQFFNQSVRDPLLHRCSSGTGSFRKFIDGTKGDSQKVSMANVEHEVWDSNILYERRSIETRNFTHEMEIDIVVFRGTQWDKSSILQRFRYLTNVLKQCKIRVNKIDITVADAPNGWDEVDGMDVRARETTIVKSLKRTNKPVFFYVKSSRQTATGYSFPEYFVGDSDPLVNTIWMAELSKSLGLSPSLEAHEITHVLANSGHVDFGAIQNILAKDPDLQNDDISESQCNNMRHHKYVTEISR